MKLLRSWLQDWIDLTDIDDPAGALTNATLRSETVPTPAGATPDTQTGTDTTVTE